MDSRRKTSRRQFLKGTAALDALQDLQWESADAKVRFASPGSASLSGRHADPLVQVGRRAMACEFQILCHPGRYPGAIEAANDALDLIDELEDQLSVFREHSEVMRINQSAQCEPCGVESELFALLSRCVEWSRATEGAFDITAGPLCKLWGFHNRQGRFPAVDEIKRVKEYVGSQYVELDQDRKTVRFMRRGVELNLGSVGKGYAIDRAADLLDAAGVCDFMLHGGQSSILARGVCEEKDETRECVPWSVALRHPLRPERRLAQLVVRDCAIGTSGSGQQFFYHRGRRYGHVLDPRTGAPAEGVLSATVLAPRAARADALATTFFVLGVDATRTYCEQHQDLSVVFVLPGARQGTVAIETIRTSGVLQLLEP